jgi:hypothetical protein
MSLYYCKNCTLTNQDCGPWDDQSNLFRSILLIHKNHEGFQAGEPSNIAKVANKFFMANIDEWFHQLVAHSKPDKCCLIKKKGSHTA